MRKHFLISFIYLASVLSCTKDSMPPAGISPGNSTNTSSSSDDSQSFSSIGDATAFIKKDGTLWTFGIAHLTGREPSVATKIPQQVGSDKDWIGVAVGSTAFAIKQDGTLWSWGLADYVGRTGKNLIPVKINDDKDWAYVHASSNNFAFAIKKDGSLWGCGEGSAYFNNGGSFGDGTTNDRPLMTRIGTLKDWKKIITMGSLVFALKTDGSLWGWGTTYYSADRNYVFGSEDGKLSPVKLTPGNDWLDVTPTGLSVIALRKDGTLWGWGKNGNTTISPQQPIQIGTSNDWAKITSTVYLFCALKKDGSLWRSSLPNVGELLIKEPTAGTLPRQQGTFSSIYRISGTVGVLGKRAEKDEYCPIEINFLFWSDFYGGEIFLNDPKNLLSLQCTSF